MSRATFAGLVIASLGASLSGCATAPVQTATSYASQGANATYHVAATGAHAVYTTGGDVYSGVGAAAKQPFHDLNMMQDPIPPVLMRAESKPYDAEGLDSCDAILNKVAQLDLALGPDLDSPKDRKKDRTARTATLAAAAAIEAASSAAEGFLPMRSVIKQVSGASRYENHVKRAVLAGTERRAFLKAMGMQHNCSWPAAPLGFHPVVVAIQTTPLAVPPPPTSPLLYATGGMITTRDAAVGSAPVRLVSAEAARRPLRTSRTRRASTLRASYPTAPATPAKLASASPASVPPATVAQAAAQAAPLQQMTMVPASPVQTSAPLRSLEAYDAKAHRVTVAAASPRSRPVALAARSTASISPAIAEPGSASTTTPAGQGLLATSPSAAFAAPWDGPRPPGR